MAGSKTGVKISVRVHPNAPANEVTGFTDNILRVKISAPPVKGKANEELIAFLCQILNVSKGEVCLMKGHTTRNKLLSIDGVSQQQVLGRLSVYSKH